MIIQLHQRYKYEPSATLQINEQMNTQICKDKIIYRLGFGGSPLPPPQRVIKKYQESINETHYPNVIGEYELRVQVVDFIKHMYDLNFTADSLFIYPGSKEAIFHFLSIMPGTLLLY